MPMGRQNPLLLIGRDFEFYCLQLKKPAVGIPKILVFFLVGMRIRVVFHGSSGYFSHRDDFWAKFSSGEGVPPGL